MELSPDKIESDAAFKGQWIRDSQLDILCKIQKFGIGYAPDKVDDKLIWSILESQKLIAPVIVKEHPNSYTITPEGRAYIKEHLHPKRHWFKEHATVIIAVCAIFSSVVATGAAVSTIFFNLDNKHTIEYNIPKSNQGVSDD